MDAAGVRYSPFGSIPILSLTAERMRCLQPRYRSVVWIETWPSRNCICSSSPPAAWHSLAQVLLLCRMRHKRRYAESRIMPNRCEGCSFGVELATNAIN
jgi:hypothetical protein